MKVQISDIVSGKDRNKKIEYKFEMPQFEFEGDTIKPVSSCSVVGRISADGDILILTAEVKVDLEMICSRCLDTFIYPIDIDIEERFTTNSESEDEEAVVVIDDVLVLPEGIGPIYSSDFNSFRNVFFVGRHNMKTEILQKESIIFIVYGKKAT